MEELTAGKIEKDLLDDLLAQRVASATNIIEFGQKPKGDIKVENPDQNPEDEIPPELKKIFEIIKGVAEELYKDKKKESEDWEGFSKGEKESMLLTMMKGALRVQYEKRLVALGAPSDEEAVNLFIEDILQGII